MRLTRREKERQRSYLNSFIIKLFLVFVVFQQLWRKVAADTRDV